MKKDLIRETGLSETDIRELRENYIMRYAVDRGWDRENLTNEQLNEIISQPEYAKPGLLYS